jgi:hypothetical protein
MPEKHFSPSGESSQVPHNRRFEGGEKGSVPGALRVAHHRPGRRSVGFVADSSPDERSDIREQQRG